ncbi:NRDE family protein [Lacimicrobium alkaliphilum]|uniref:NRDE family protein n=1 Tax=Lacimicrobium alkaliphilum TaxID=1526571 RepID=A0ABQ1R4I6_9ALTE|nr:NRDE family protein [Lacimicrobium alkaliphilum]GGD54697.1 hypothetical protein GCM10011357_08000 [Lacimicrobium alkaliphilum]
MCILFIAVNKNPHYPLVIAANRDEFFARPTAQSGFWPDSPEVLAGKDLEAGGSWMGVTTHGRIAALTNIRDPKRMVANRKSRGKLVLDYLKQAEHAATPKGYLQWLEQCREAFNGYNLLFGQYRPGSGVQLNVYNNHTNSHTTLDTGIYGLSNADINSPWPKTSRGVQALSANLDNIQPEDERLFSILKDAQQANDADLPETGIPREWEKQLSSIFIRGEDYGTRSSTLLLMDNKGHLHWSERTFNNQGEATKTISFSSHFER